jgi:tetratricopeptide (TPR) repeat protein
VGTILGSTSSANLGDRDGARRQYERAHEILQPLLTRTAPFEVVRSVVDADLRLSGIAQTKGEHDQAVTIAREAVTHATAYRSYKADDVRGAELQARTYFALASALPRPEAMPVWYQTLEYYEKLLASQPDSAQTQRNVALVGKSIGANLEARDAAAALKHYARSLELDEKRLGASPDDPRVQFDVAISFSNVASVSELLGDIETAGRLFERSLVLRRQIAQADPSNEQARGRLGYLLARIGRFHLPRDPSAALAFSREAVDLLEASLVATKDFPTRVTLARAWNQIGRSEMSLKAGARACAAFRRSHALFSQGGTTDDSGDKRQAEYSARRAAECGATR